VEYKPFLGTGWAFPPTFWEHDRSQELVSEEKDIEQSLYILISTIPGERLMNPTYGCDLYSMVFHRITEALCQELKALVTDAIETFEPRVEVENVEVHVVSLEPGILHIVVDYIVIQVNSRANIVYPFYLQEGSSVVL
jgi:uncharacterized protein